MKKLKLVCVLPLLLIVFLGARGTKTGTPRSGAPASGAPASGEETRVVIDHTGAEVVIPKVINRVVIGGLTPLPSVYCMVMGSTDKLVGIDPDAQNAAANSIMNKAFPELAELPTTFLVDYVMNVEELLKLKPDVVFNHGNMPEHHEATVAAGIPSVRFSTSLFRDENFNTIKTVNAWAALIAEVMDVKAETEPLIAYGENVEKMVAGRLADIPEADKARVLMLYNYNGNVITAAGQTFGKYWVTAGGGRYLTDDIPSGTAEIDMERVYELDPDVIFLSSFSAYAPEDFYNSAVGRGHDWTMVKAVRDRRVYKFPLGTYYWYPPNSDASLALQWFAKSLYPERFESLDLDQEIKDYYQRYYGVEVTDSDLHSIYFPSEESATNW